MITHTFVAEATSSEKRGPERGDSSAARAASVASSTGAGSSGKTAASRFSCGISSSSVSRETLLSSPDAPIVSGSSDS